MSAAPHGAVTRHPGRFELARRHAVLDEIGDLPMEIQVKLLRVLQERSFERVGGSETLSVDVRIISATHRNLEALVAEGPLSRDLYHRPQRLPHPLAAAARAHRGRAAPVSAFLQKWRQYSGGRVVSIEPAALDLLTRYSFPGNVRELENLIQRA